MTNSYSVGVSDSSFLPENRFCWRRGKLGRGVGGGHVLWALTVRLEKVPRGKVQGTEFLEVPRPASLRVIANRF